MAQKQNAFTFGENWAQFARLHFSEERIAVAQKHLLNFLGMESLAGKTFVLFMRSMSPGLRYAARSENLL